MNYFGLVIGTISLLMIGLGFPLVILTERLLGHLWWPYMMMAGLLFIGASIFVRNDWLSVVTAVVGATIVWGSTELKEQAIRAELGWFPSGKRKLQAPFASIIRRWKVPHL